MCFKWYRKIVTYEDEDVYFIWQPYLGSSLLRQHWAIPSSTQTTYLCCSVRLNFPCWAKKTMSPLSFLAWLGNHGKSFLGSIVIRLAFLYLFYPTSELAQWRTFKTLTNMKQFQSNISHFIISGPKLCQSVLDSLNTHYFID